MKDSLLISIEDNTRDRIIKALMDEVDRLAEHTTLSRKAALKLVREQVQEKIDLSEAACL